MQPDSASPRFVRADYGRRVGEPNLIVTTDNLLPRHSVSNKSQGPAFTRTLCRMAEDIVGVDEGDLTATHEGGQRVEQGA